MEILLIFLQCVAALNEKYDVKYEINTPNQISITPDKINIHITKDPIRIRSKPKVNFSINNVINYKEIEPFKIRRDNEGTKHKLDKFELHRKQSHITTIEYNFDVPIFNLKRTYNKDNEKHIKDRRDENREYYTEKYINNKYIGEIDNRISQEFNLNFIKSSQIEEVLKRQNFLVDRLVRVLKEEKKALRSDFNTLIKEMEKLKTENVTQKQVVIQGPVKPATLVNIDETQIRKALKQDPFVRRVLQMGKSKRDAYEKEAKAYNQG